MFDFLQEPEQLWPLIKSLGGAALLVVLVIVVYRLATRGLQVFCNRGSIPPEMAVVLRRILRWAAVVIGAIFVLQSFGFLKGFWALVSTMLALVAIGFVAVWSVLSNVLCAFVLLVARPFRVGDMIELPVQNLKGTVVDFNLIFTILRGDRNDLIQIPNNTFFQAPIRRTPGDGTVNLNEQLRKEAEES